MSSRSELASMVEQLTEPSGSGSFRMLSRAGLCLAIGVVLVTGYHTPMWLVPFGIVFQGVSLAWFYLIQKDTTDLNPKTMYSFSCTCKLF